MEIFNSVCTIYIVRHGQSQSNAAKIMGGYFDPQLTDEGIRQAEERRKEFAGIKFNAVFSSDFCRAKRTAEIISAERQLAVNTRELLRERNYGTWEGRPEAEVMAENKHLFEKIKTLSEEEKREFKYNTGYENENEIAARFITALREIAVTYIGQTVLVASHGAIMRSFLTHLGFANYDELPIGSIVNTGYLVIESDGVDFFIRQTVGVNKQIE